MKQHMLNRDIAMIFWDVRRTALSYGPRLTGPSFSIFCGTVRRKIWPVMQSPHVIRALLILLVLISTNFYYTIMSY